MRMRIHVAFIAALVTAGLACSGQGRPKGGIGVESSPKLTVRQGTIVDVRTFGAVGDGKTKDTAAIAKAIDDCATGGGGTVKFPAGVYFTGAVRLKSHVTLDIESGATLLFSTDPADYPIVLTRWECTECYNFSPLIYGYQLQDIAITGRGTIDGQGKAWWTWTKHARAASDRLRDMNEKDVSVEQRRFGTVEDGLRPQLVQFYDCKGVTIEGVTLKDGPFWTIDPVYCENVVIRDVTIRCHGPNTDGIDPDSCKNMLIERCDIDSGDDCIAVKSGRNRDGRRVGRPTQDLEIRNCRFGIGHGGVAIGSETSGGIRHVWIHDCLIDGSNRGIFIKTMRGRGAVIQDILAERLMIKSVKDTALMVSMHYQKTDPEPASERTPAVRNVILRDVICEQAKAAINIAGLEEREVENIQISRVKLTAATGMSCTRGNNVTLEDARIEAAKGPLIDCQDSAGLRVRRFGGVAQDGSPLIRLVDTQDAVVSGVKCAEGTNTFATVGGITSRNVEFIGNDTHSAKHGVVIDRVDYKAPPRTPIAVPQPATEATTQPASGASK